MPQRKLVSAEIVKVAEAMKVCEGTVVPCSTAARNRTDRDCEICGEYKQERRRSSSSTTKGIRD